MGGPIIANSGALMTDLWPAGERCAPLAVYTAVCYCGPVIGPMLGGVLTQYAGWRWNFWMVLMVSGVYYVVMVVVLPETYTIRSNANTGLSPRELLGEFGRPWKMLATEPILLPLSTLMAFTYGVLFLDFSAYPIVFTEQRGRSLSLSGLSFLGVGLGMVIATALSPLLDHQYTSMLASSPSGKLPPEFRLRHLIYIAWLLPASIFWFAWSASPPTHWIVTILSGIPFGLSVVLLLSGINTHLTDCYGRDGASALAANAVLRSLFGASFALFARQLYDSLGTPWATSLLGFIALALAPVPFVLWRFGPWLRARSNFPRWAVQDC
jgi:MFS family permease